jgi:hypothetical protein
MTSSALGMFEQAPATCSRRDFSRSPYVSSAAGALEPVIQTHAEGLKRVVPDDGISSPTNE